MIMGGARSAGPTSDDGHTTHVPAPADLPEVPMIMGGA